MSPLLKKIVLFGDSLTQQCFTPGGWGCTLADHFVRRCDIVNRGFSGYTSKGFQIIFQKLLKEFKSDEIACITLLLGANDQADSIKNPLQHVPLADFSKNLNDLVQAALDHGLTKNQIILISPPPLVGYKFEAFCREVHNKECDRSNDVCQTYVDAVKQVSSDSGITFVPLFDIMSSMPNVDDLLSDGLHLSQDGSGVLAEAFIPILESKVERKEMIGPQWRDMTEETLSTFC